MTTAIWPNLFIVGAAKCGTTSLYEYLRAHPQVFFPDMKEPNFFLTQAPLPKDARRLAPLHCIGQPQKYLGLYRNGGGYPVRGDASVAYLWDENAPRLIQESCPRARIVIMLRDPVVRAHSHYLMHLRNGAESEPSFLAALRKDMARKYTSVWEGGGYMEFGLFHDQVRRYLRVFGKEQVLILLLDELAKSPRETMARVTRYLDIDPMPVGWDKVLGSEHNQYTMPRMPFLYLQTKRLVDAEMRRKFLPSSLRKWLRTSFILYNNQKPPLDNESRRILEGIYDPDIDRLEKLLGRGLPELRKSWQQAPAPPTKETVE